MNLWFQKMWQDFRAINGQTVLYSSLNGESSDFHALETDFTETGVYITTMALHTEGYTFSPQHLSILRFLGDKCCESPYPVATLRSHWLREADSSDSIGSHFVCSRSGNPLVAHAPWIVWRPMTWWGHSCPSFCWHCIQILKIVHLLPTISTAATLYMPWALFL